MHARFWLALACGVGVGLVWLLAGGARGVGRVAARDHEAPVSAAKQVDLSALEAPTPTEPSRAAGAGSASVAEREPGRPTSNVPARAASSVVVHVRLTLASGETRSFAGWRVELQSWLAATNETSLHEGTADAAGVSEFVFPGFVHVDWLRCQPPPESGLALGYAERHDDLEPGERMNETLELAPGGVLAARVVDLAGAPVGGARVHAYSENYAWDFSDWQPGLVQAVTGADGRADLPPLPPGTWSVGVEPRDWLQLDPEPGNSRGEHAVEAGQRLEATELRVAPLHRVRLRVRDASGRPVVGASVELAPLELRVEGLTARRPAADPLALFLGRAEPPRVDEGWLVWPHGELYWRTDPEGVAEIYGVQGRWALTVTPELGTGAGSSEPLRAEIELPGPALSLDVPAALAELRGRVVDEQGRGLEGAEATLHRADDDDWYSEARSGADGTFVLRGLPPSLEYWLQLSQREHLPVRSAVWVAGDLEAGTFELRRASSLRICLVDPSGAPLRRRSLAILAHRPRESLRPAESEWFAKYGRATRQTNETGRVEFARLAPGEVELALNLPVAAPSSGASARPAITMSPFQRWVVPVGAGEVRLVADLSGYVAPAQQPQPAHVGVVLDARSGAPLAGAWVCLRAGGGVQQARTDGDGRFRVVPAVGAHAIHVLHPGYAPFEESEREWAPAVHEHRFALHPGAPELRLEFQDRDGERLPCVDVAVTGGAGARLLALARTGGPFVPLNGQRLATDGSLSLSAFSSERLRFELSIAGVVLGSGEVDAGRAGGAATVRLDRSLAELRRELEDAQGAGE